MCIAGDNFLHKFRGSADMLDVVALARAKFRHGESRDEVRIDFDR